MKKRTGIIIILVAVLALGIGYAAMSGVTLNVDGAGIISVDDSNFKVHFQDPAQVSGDGTVVATITDDLNAEFDISDFTKRGDSTTIVYTIVNESDGINATLAAPVVDNFNDTAFGVTVNLSSNTIAAGGSATLTIEVEALTTPTIDDLDTIIKVSVDANPTV